MRKRFFWAGEGWIIETSKGGFHPEIPPENGSARAPPKLLSRSDGGGSGVTPTSRFASWLEFERQLVRCAGWTSFYSCCAVADNKLISMASHVLHVSFLNTRFFPFPTNFSE